MASENSATAARGVIYITTGPSYLAEAVKSARSVQRFHPGLPILLFTDQVGFTSPVFHEVRHVSDSAHPFQVKVKYLRESPFERTLFLDTDTLVKKPIAEMFDWLDDFDFAIANEPLNDWEHRPNELKAYKNERHLNTGVMLFRKGDAWERFWEQWYAGIAAVVQEDIRHGVESDQCHCNRLLFGEQVEELGLKWMVFDNLIYNARGIMFRRMKQEGLWREAKILHCHSVHADWKGLFRLKWLGLKKRLGIHVS